jgi:hypothetical protein
MNEAPEKVWESILANDYLKKYYEEQIQQPKPEEIPAVTVSVSQPPKVVNRKFCYWTVADGDQAKMAAVLVDSARRSGVEEDFHVWTDLKGVKGAFNHPCGNFNNTKAGCWFKLEFLLNEVSKLDYEYVCWLDADHYFVRKPRSIMDHVGDALVMIPMENELNSRHNKRGDWWGVPKQKSIEIFRQFGCRNELLYNTNGGLFVVKKTFIKTFYHMCYEFHYMIKSMGWTVPEEYCLAIMGCILNQNILRCTSYELLDIWACDWTNQFVEHLPRGDVWELENYLTGVRSKVNPAICHLMRGKRAMVNYYERNLLV